MFGMLAMLVIGFFTLAIMVLLVVWIARMSSSPTQFPHLDERWRPPQGDRSFDIVRERYARGEISADDYYRYCETLGRCQGDVEQSGSRPWR